LAIALRRYSADLRLLARSPTPLKERANDQDEDPAGRHIALDIERDN
jgi:hypothetical protein